MICTFYLQKKRLETCESFKSSVFTLSVDWLVTKFDCIKNKVSLISGKKFTKRPTNTLDIFSAL